MRGRESADRRVVRLVHDHGFGVELGQLAIVAAFLPAAFALRRTRAYNPGLLRGGSLLIAGLAAVWFIERAFALKLLPFG